MSSGVIDLVFERLKVKYPMLSVFVLQKLEFKSKISLLLLFCKKN